MNIITLDFESEWSKDYTLKKLTTLEYVRDERFRLFGACVKVNDQPTQWLRYDAFEEFARRLDWTKVAVLAHHAQFEGLILRERFGVDRVGFWFDTLSMGRGLFSGEIGLDLGELGAYLGLTVQKGAMPDIQGKRREDLTDAEWHDLAVYCRTDVDSEYEAFAQMLGRYSKAELRLIDLTIRMFAEPWLKVDLPLLSEYAQYEADRRETLLAEVGATPETFRSDAKFAALLKSIGIEPPTKINKVGETKFAFAKDDPGMQALLEHDDETIAQLAECRVTFKSTLRQSRTQRILNAGAAGQSVPVYLKYAAANTGRWAGGDKMNWQNLDRVKTGPDRKPVYGTGMMRLSLVAPEGEAIVVADSAQIEARFTAYLAGQNDVVDGFRNKEDLYSKFATIIYRRLVDRKKNPEDFIPGFVGKTCILGLGFGMWWPKFAATMLKGALGGPPVVFGPKEIEEMDVNYGLFLNNPKNLEAIQAIPTRLRFEELTYHCAVAKTIVETYRERNSHIVSLWDYCDKLIPLMKDQSGYTFQLNGVPFEVGYERIILPSGRSIRYPNLRRQKGGRGWVYDTAEGPATLYGAKFVENFVQALARDAVAYQMLDVSEYMRIITMTHDEIVGGVRQSDAEAALERTIKIMSASPTWAPNIPLAAEGGFGRSYGEIK